jgi:protein phosphatase-4 regulatory subunit 3
MKAIIIDMFDKYEPTMARLAERPYVRLCVLGLRVRWDQYREPPPQPTAQALESNQTKTAAEEEEDWFNRSDEEGASPATRSLLPSKRKRLLRKQQLASPKSSGALGLDYDDASDSEGSVEGEKATSNVETNQLVDDLTDVEAKIRAKRQRAEQEDEDGALAGLVGKTGAASKKGDDMGGGGGQPSGGNTKEKKIRLSLGGLAKKLNKT